MKPNDEYEELIRIIAHRLSYSDIQGLQLELSEEECESLGDDLPSKVSVNEKVLTFLDGEFYSQIVAEALLLSRFQDLSHLSDDDIEYFLQLYRNDRSSKTDVCSTVLVLLGDELNVLHQFAVHINQQNVFSVLELLANYISKRDRVDPKDLFELCISQYPFTKHDYAKGMFFNKLAQLLIGKSMESAEIIEIFRSESKEETASLYTSAIFSIVLTDASHASSIVINDFHSANLLLRSAALQMAGELVDLNSIGTAVNQELRDIISNSLLDTEPLIRESATVAVRVAAKRTHTMDDCLFNLIEGGDQYIIYAASQVLFHYFDDPNRYERLGELLPTLFRKFSNTNTSTLYLDHLASKLLSESSQFQLVVTAFESWLVLGDEPMQSSRDIIDRFGATISLIVAKEEYMSVLITRWFMSDHIALVFSAGQILSRAEAAAIDSVYSPRFDLSLIDNDTFDGLLLAIVRTIAFVKTPEVQIALVVSLLDSKLITEDHVQIIKDFLLVDLGYEYGGLLIKSLKSYLLLSKRKHISNLCRSVVDILEKEHDRRRSLPKRRELEPDPRLVLDITRWQSRAFYESFKNIESESAYSKIATKIPVKAGRKILAYGRQEDSSTIHMQEVVFTKTLPNNSILDPVGFAMKIYRYASLGRSRE